MNHTYIDPGKLNNDAKLELAKVIDNHSTLTVKERLAIPPQAMPTQAPSVRINNINEVALGYTVEEARLEAMRCLNCKNKPCVNGCPVAVDIPGFVTAIANGDFKRSAAVLKQSTLLPAVCGRVCPQEIQCQETCTVGKALKDVDKSVAIGRLERFIADWERENDEVNKPTIKPSTGKKVAIVGSGPASLVVAADVRREGHDVTIFEAFHKLGGVMLYGIPEFRLPKDIVQKEIDLLVNMGINIETNYVVGKTRKLKDMLDEDGFDAIFVGTGAGLPIFMNVEGENLVGVLSANEYLTRANLMKAYDKKHADTPIYASKKVAVLGGGNVAMDAARTAIRLGADEVNIIYRRTEREMPARLEEVAHAKEEGVIFRELENLKRCIGDGKGSVSQIECLRYELGEMDSSARRRPVEIPDSEFSLEMDTVIIAIGNNSNPLIPQTTPGLDCDKRGNILTNEDKKTSIDKIYAGGDIVLGAATVILAMGEGRKAATSINKLLS